MISDSLDEVTKVFLNINETMKIKMNEGQQQYMKWHRENLFKLNNEKRSTYEQQSIGGFNIG